MTELEHLWLDFNLISTLPQGFHHLTKLKELKMDGNTLIHPPIEVIVKGAKEVIKWCRLKLAAKESAREKNIVLDTLSLLEQVGKNQVVGLANGREQHHASVYEANVLYKEGEKYDVALGLIQLSKIIFSTRILHQNITVSVF